MAVRYTMDGSFKQVREDKGLTIEEVAAKTKIQSEYLRALEENRFAELPGPVFAKGFVRTYARFLGMDEEETVRRFSESAQELYVEQNEREQRFARQYAEKRRRAINRNVVIVLTGVALVGLVFLLTQHQEPASREAEPVQKPSVEDSILPAVPAPEIGVSPDTIEETPQGGDQGQTNEGGTASDAAPLSTNEGERIGIGGTETSVESTVGQKPLVLDVEAIELTWLMVEVDGQDPEEVLLRPGDEVSWRASSRLDVTIGNAGGVRMSLNGEPQPMLGKSGQVVRDLVFTREDLRETESPSP